MNKCIWLLVFYLVITVNSIPLKYKKYTKTEFKYIGNLNIFGNKIVNNFYEDFVRGAEVENEGKYSWSFKCSVCELMVNAVRLVLRHNLPRDTIIRYAVDICAEFYVEEICKGAVKMFKGEIFEVLSTCTLTSSEVCQVLTTHNCSHTEIQALKWILDIPPRNNTNAFGDRRNAAINDAIVNSGGDSHHYDGGDNNNLIINGSSDEYDSNGGIYNYNNDLNYVNNKNKIDTNDNIQNNNEVRLSEEDIKNNINKNTNYNIDNNDLKNSNNNKNIKKGITNKPYHVLHISDIHLDLHYKPSSNAQCSQPLCCRQGHPSDSRARAGYWGDYRRCDLPLWTLENALRKMSEQRYDYIIWTGDTISHNVWNQSISEQVHVLNIIISLFRFYFPNTVVFSALGNHESVPVNSFPTPTSNESISWLYESVYHLWSQWLPNDAKETVLKAGYYTAKLPNTNLRIISLNMNFCNNLNGWLLLNAKDPYDQLKWFIKLLLQAEADGEKVHVIGHIPPGLPECVKWWSFNYNNIVRRFHDTISGQFFGHLHFDTFEIFYDEEMREDETISRPISVAYLTPSLTTFVSNNPAYRVYEVEPSNWTVTDHKTYIMDLETSNANHKANWTLQYSAKEAYKMFDLSAESFDDLVKRMKDDEKLFDLYFRYFYKSHPGSKKCDQTCKRMMLCSMVSSQSYDYNHCQRLVANKYRRADKSKQESFIDGPSAQEWQEKYLEWEFENKVC